MRIRVCKLTFEHLMRVKQLDIGDKTYVLNNQPELPAGIYEVWVDGSNVEFEKVGGFVSKETLDMITNLTERSEHN